MQKIKNLVCSLILLVCLSAVCFFGGCASTLSGTMTIVIHNPDVQTSVQLEIDLSLFKSGDSVMDVLEKCQDDGKIYYVAQDSAYGAYFTEIGTFDNDGEKVVIIKESYTAVSSIFVDFYTTVESDTAFAQTRTWQGITVGQSAFGASQMKIEDGATIYITQGEYFFNI